MNNNFLKDIKILLASPRGFCAGVDRAIKIVEQALDIFGAPVYVRHEIVHNRYIVDYLKGLGAVFVEELEECPEEFPVIISAHGAPIAVLEEAKRRNVVCIDATCPLVTKVHMEVRSHHMHGRKVIMVGHSKHAEVLGTMGQVPDGVVILVETKEDALKVDVGDHKGLAYITQTTLSVDDTSEIVNVLKDRFPHIIGPRKDDICYATSNRQEAVKRISDLVDVFFVIGSSNSSNSNRLVEVAQYSGCPRSFLIDNRNDLDWGLVDLPDVQVVGLTAGASAPGVIMDDVINAFKERYSVSIEEIFSSKENMEFSLPVELEVH